MDFERRRDLQGVHCALAQGAVAVQQRLDGVPVRGARYDVRGWVLATGGCGSAWPLGGSAQPLGGSTRL
ncbi:hypothetical protein [Streptomyces sp. CC224B]|uniref:hypothetical protein n=1 Tax=Streptomyces sp. CC224B TaxID=3044571 RepID=UPI0024A9B44A|nr:hypothetical protein [Streptomyces sp. CC224B]